MPGPPVWGGTSSWGAAGAGAPLVRASPSLPRVRSGAIVRVDVTHNLTRAVTCTALQDGVVVGFRCPLPADRAPATAGTSAHPPTTPAESQAGSDVFTLVVTQDKVCGAVRVRRRARVAVNAGPRGGGGGNNSQTTPGNNQHNPQHANYWAPLTRKRHIPPHPAQPRHTNHWAPRTRKRHQQEHRPQRPTERSDPTQHAKGRTGDCPGPRKETATRGTVTRGGGGVNWAMGSGGGGALLPHLKWS